MRRARIRTAAPRGADIRFLLACAALASLGIWVCYRVEPLASLGHMRALSASLWASIPLALAARRAERIVHVDRGHLLLLLAGVVALFSAVPWDDLIGSDDATRYVWDGRVLAHWINPFAHPPQDEALAGIRDSRFFPHIYRPDMRTVYPPLSQLWFLAAYLIHPTGHVGLKLVLLLNSLASALLLWTLLRRRGHPPLRALVFAWSPLLVVELAGGGHLDGLLCPWLLASVLLSTDRPLWSGVCLGASAMVRPITLLALPALAVRRPWSWRQSLKIIAGFCIVCLVALAPFLTVGRALVESLLVYSGHWRFNGSLFQLAESLFGRLRLVRFSLYGAVFLLAVGSAFAPLALETRMLIALGGYLALAPTVYPWYALPVLALGALEGGPLWLALPSLLQLTQLVRLEKAFGRKWRLPLSTLLVEYLPLYVLVGWHALRRRCPTHNEHDPTRTS